MTGERTLERFRDYLVGPARFMNVMSCFELGIVDALRGSGGRTADELGNQVDAAPEAIEQLMQLLVKDDLVTYDEESGRYALAGLGALADDDLHRVLAIMKMVKTVMLRQSFHLTESVRRRRPVGLETIYGYQGNLYGALAEHDDLRRSWSTMMDAVTAHIDPWFFDNIDVATGARVLDLAGNTGLGAILAYRAKESRGLRVATFDLPEKEAECLRNFKAHDVEEHCTFIGGDVFREVPQGFDVVLIKHFLDMFDKPQVMQILRNTHQALNVGGQVNILGPVYSEDIKSSSAVDFFPTYFLGCSMGQGGPQKLSTYARWLEEAGFTVTKAVAQDPAEMPADALVAHGILCATKNDR
ncbi:methyltransferase [Micromonospora sp. C95]|uniref:methyltransferase n=1 Tax=Micromonospora sp. C95 TaxID=2824882 RepID=UPI001B365CF6|nr:methyltransferase [Micromonospora sp. C95]MBQ1023699.1 methyltransferase domain-containing protein [Micromonospora sp. C95]